MTNADPMKFGLRKLERPLNPSGRGVHSNKVVLILFFR